jgi:hypothetical protein
MITLPRILKLAADAEHARLLEEILDNGRPLPLAARLRLSSDAGLPAAALSLALTRFVELTWAPTPQTLDLLDRLLACEDARHAGWYATPAATAAAAAALLGVAAQRQRVADPLAPATRTAAERALAALHETLDAAAAGGADAGRRHFLQKDDQPDALDRALSLALLAPAAGQASSTASSAGAADGPDAVADWVLEELDALESLGARHDRTLAPLIAFAEACVPAADAGLSADVSADIPADAVAA